MFVYIDTITYITWPHKNPEAHKSAQILSKLTKERVRIYVSRKISMVSKLRYEFVSNIVGSQSEKEAFDSIQFNKYLFCQYLLGANRCSRCQEYNSSDKVLAVVTQNCYMIFPCDKRGQQLFKGREAFLGMQY